MSARAKNQHIVSRGYLKHFAQERPGRGKEAAVHEVRLILKRNDEDRGPVSIRDAFAKRNFNTFTVKGAANDQLEHHLAEPVGAGKHVRASVSVVDVHVGTCVIG